MSEDQVQKIAFSVTRSLLDRFNRHYAIFRQTTLSAKQCFENADWQAIQKCVRGRTHYYAERVNETVQYLIDEYHADQLDQMTWQQVKLAYIQLRIEHQQPELSETFLNSVFCRILHQDYYHNKFIFFRPTISTDYIESKTKTYRCYYPLTDGLKESIRSIISDFGWVNDFENLSRDIGRVVKRVCGVFLKGSWLRTSPNFQIQVLSSPFYRNKGAYIIGKVINSNQEYPFAVPVLHGSDKRLFLDTILLESDQIRGLFSLSRAYFLVGMEVPANYVHFLKTLIPNKNLSEIYTMLGLGKQGKTDFYRDFISHLFHSTDEFIVAPGIRGLVMLVFTLPSYPYVFKLIKDRFGVSKNIDHKTVREKYLLVKLADRVGRMADTLEFSHVAFPKNRFSPDLLAELKKEVSSLVIESDEEIIIIKHLYIERRMTPLNLALKASEEANDDQKIVFDYGQAIRELASSNIFPGDLLWKNFGITRDGRVVFYDYDEIELMTGCCFRIIPPPPTFEAEMSGEPWYSVRDKDIFPEEFASFLLGSARVRALFMKYHADLLKPDFWKKTQQLIEKKETLDFYPYPQTVRFKR